MKRKRIIKCVEFLYLFLTDRALGCEDLVLTYLALS